MLLAAVELSELRLLLAQNLNGFPDDDDPMQTPWWAVITWVVAFALILLVAMAGNCLVCFIVLSQKHMRTPTNCFLVNLSLASLLMISLNTTFNLLYLVRADWWLGLPFCTVSNFVSSLTVTATVLTMVAISIERYMVIVHPLRRKIRRREALCSIVFIWLISCSISLPCLLFSNIVTHRLPSGAEVHGCVLLWPDSLTLTSCDDYVYNIVFLIITYILPIFFMAICYAIIGRQLWVSGIQGFKSEAQLSVIRSRRKIARMFFVVVVAFALLWLPYHVYSVYTYRDIRLAQHKYVQHLFLAFDWLAMSHAMVNPIVYFWMSGRFRAFLANKCCFRQQRPPLNGRVQVVLAGVAGVTPVTMLTGSRLCPATLKCGGSPNTETQSSPDINGKRLAESL